MKENPMRKQTRRTNHIVIDTSKCEACWDCIDECKHNTLGKVNFWFHKHVAIKKAENCRGCKKCINVCPKGVFESVKLTQKAANF